MAHFFLIVNELRVTRSLETAVKLRKKKKPNNKTGSVCLHQIQPGWGNCCNWDLWTQAASCHCYVALTKGYLQTISSCILTVLECPLLQTERKWSADVYRVTARAHWTYELKNTDRSHTHEPHSTLHTCLDVDKTLESSTRFNHSISSFGPSSNVLTNSSRDCLAPSYNM